MNGLNHKRTLILGIGNNARSDDGLGWAFSEKLEAAGFFKGDIEYRYQLQVEDAALLTAYDQVIFIDATKTNYEKGFCWEEAIPEKAFTYSTHSLNPETIVFLTKDLYGKTPYSALLSLQGYYWDLDIGMSERAQMNLKAAFDFFQKILMQETVCQ